MRCIIDLLGEMQCFVCCEPKYLLGNGTRENDLTGNRNDKVSLVLLICPEQKTCSYLESFFLKSVYARVKLVFESHENMSVSCHNFDPVCDITA